MLRAHLQNSRLSIWGKRFSVIQQISIGKNLCLWSVFEKDEKKNSEVKRMRNRRLALAAALLLAITSADGAALAVSGADFFF